MARVGTGGEAPTDLYLAGLPADWDEARLMELHDDSRLEVTSVAEVKLLKQKQANNLRSAIVKYTSNEEARKALDLINGQPVSDGNTYKPIVARFAEFGNRKEGDWDQRESYARPGAGPQAPRDGWNDWSSWSPPPVHQARPIRVRDHWNGRSGAVIGYGPHGSARIRFDDGEDCFRDPSNFETPDGRQFRWEDHAFGRGDDWWQGSSDRSWGGRERSEWSPPMHVAARTGRVGGWQDGGDWGSWSESHPSRSVGWNGGGAATARAAARTRQGSGAAGRPSPQLVRKALDEVAEHLNRPGAEGRVWITNWPGRYQDALGHLRDFLEDHPEEFTVVQESGRRYTVEFAEGKGPAHQVEKRKEGNNKIKKDSPQPRNEKNDDGKDNEEKPSRQAKRKGGVRQWTIKKVPEEEGEGGGANGPGTAEVDGDEEAAGEQTESQDSEGAEAVADGFESSASL
mmetsp:Transcript_17622/g.37392  ORF Transcript_17622/g.37392 Transcript_17622/m.37392 type:complete len:456 (+) Transcript_17622:46-1413(+)